MKLMKIKTNALLPLKLKDDEFMLTKRASILLGSRLASTIFFLSLLPPPAWAQPGPSITQQPASQTALAGSNVTLKVVVAGTGPFTYRWQLNGVNLFPNYPIITTVAGNGSSGYSGDGGAATNAGLDYPTGVAVDASGNLFVADQLNNRIRKVDGNGIITTAAGSGLYGSNRSGGYSGDGGPATNAGLNCPAGVAVDASGNLFIADSENERIRKVDANGIISTVAGNGVTVLVGPIPILHSGTYSGDGGAATNGGLNGPLGVAVDGSGNLFIVDYDNYRIRKVDTNGIITTVAGDGSYGYSGDGGAAANASLWNPSSVAVDGSGNLFIADSGNNRIRKVDAYGIITTVAGIGSYSYSGDGGPATNAGLSYPSGVAADASGNLFIADSNNGRIRKVDTYGIITTVAGGGYSGDGGAATNASVAPSGVAVDAFGNLFIVDTDHAVIRQVALGGFPTLNLEGVSAANAGEYQLIITSPYGSVTSAVATVTVLLPPRAATATANLVNDFVVGATVTDGGYGYTNTPTVSIIGGGGSGAQAVAVVSNGVVIAVNVLDAGDGYTNTPVIVIAPPFLPQPVAATATATLVNDFVVGATVTDGGFGYTNTPTVRIIGGGGSGAQAVAVVSNGVVIAVSILDAGYGYTNPPAIVIAPPFIPPPTLGIAAMSRLSFTNLALGTNYQLQSFSGGTWSNLRAAFTAAGSTVTEYVSGTASANSYRLAAAPVPSQAYATAQLDDGFVVGATVTNGGSGYATIPAVNITGGGGSGAEAVAVVSNGVVSAVNVLDAGYGYTNAPSITIAPPPPPATALWPMVTQAMELDLGSLWPYGNYQLEFSPVAGGVWSNLRLPLTPTSSTSTQYANVSGNAGFFRVEYVP